VKEHPELVEQFQQQVAESLTAVTSYEPQQLNDLLLEAGKKVFTIRRPPSLPAPAEDPEHVVTIKTMWGHYREMRKAQLDCSGSGRATLRGAIQAWRHWMQFHRMHRQVQKHSRSLRRQRFERLLAEAQAHERSGCSSAIFDLLRRHAPKQARRRAQLRDVRGKLMTPAEEAQVLLTFWQSVNGGTRPSGDEPTSYTFHITCEELRDALQRLQGNKAAPKHCAPHVFWSMASEHIATFMSEQVFHDWQQGGTRVPQDWASAWLVFLGKAGKIGDSPAHLRPIALLEPMGKAVAGILKDRLMPFVQPWTAPQHLHGYLPHRSPLQALCVVFAHCRDVRAAAQAQGRSLYDLRAGHKRGSCAGGLQLSIDCTQAFDRISRDLLQRALEMLEVPADLIGIIMQWVHSTKFHIGGHPDEVQYGSDKGIRQGCKLSPTLWVCISVYLLRRMDNTLGLNWCQQHGVGFADDLHFRWRFEDVAGMQLALKQAGTVLQLLTACGLIISKEKTVCLLRADGVQAPNAIKKVVRKTKQGKLLKLDMNWEMPLKKSHIYLGACISYENFESQNMQHRLQACRAAFSRLRTTLMAHRALNMHRRLQLWKATVVTSAMYSLLASGFSAKTMDQFRVVLTRQARAIARSPVHLDLENNDKFWRRIGIIAPVDMILQRLERAVTVTTTLKAKLREDDARISSIILDHEQAVLARTREILTEAQKAAGDAEDSLTHVCQECGAKFGTWAALRAHAGKLHSQARRQEAKEQTPDFDQQRHGKDGMPICSQCNHRFPRWADLRKHIEGGHCQAASTIATEPASGTDKDSVMQIVRAGQLDVQNLRVEAVTADLRTELMQHCALCRQWHHDHKQHIDKIKVMCEWSIHVSNEHNVPSQASAPDIPFPAEAEIKRWHGGYGKKVKHANSCSELIQNELATADMQFQEVFGPVLGKRLLQEEPKVQDRPSKQNKPANRGPKGKGKGKGGGKQFRKPQHQPSSWNSGYSGDMDWLVDAIQLMARMMVRQEDVLHVLRQSTGWVWWLSISTPTIVPDLFQAAQVWRKEVSQPDSKMANTSLRSALFWCLLHQLAATLGSMDQTKLAEANKQGWLTAEVVHLLNDMKGLVSGDTVSRFHSTRPLVEQMSGHMLTMVMDISFRKASANALYSKLEKLQGSAALQVCGVQYRKEGFKRSPGAQRSTLVACLARAVGDSLHEVVDRGDCVEAITLQCCSGCEDSDVTLQVLRLPAPWFETALTPEMYYYDPRPDDDMPDDDATIIDSSLRSSSSQSSLASDCSCCSDGFAIEFDLVRTLSDAFTDMGESRCFTTGAYIFGGEAGPFTTVTLSLNQQSGVHVDARNSRTFQNIVIPAGYWDAGELWVSRDSGCITFPGTELLGDVVPVKHPFTLLDATQPHAVFDWTGERTVVIGFHIRDAWRLQPDDLAMLADAGFHVRTCERVTDPYMSVIEVLLHIHWSVFFDDFVAVSSPEEKGHLDLVLRSYFALIGWETSDEKARKRELVSTIESIVQQGGVHAKELECLRGRLQFAESQVFGRGAAQRMRAISKAMKLSGFVVLDDSLTEALLFLKDRVLHGEARMIRACDRSTYHLFTDASYEADAPAGLGGFLYSDRGLLLRWYSESADPDVLEAINKEGKQGLIYELEACAAVQGVVQLCNSLSDCNLICYCDNEAALAALIKCASDSPVVASQLNKLSMLEDEKGISIWFERVESSANPADDPSRFVFGKLPTNFRVRWAPGEELLF
ncbi:pol, partial [Symbiodinium sp. CCMP2592]